MSTERITRREFILAGLGWLPFFRRRHATLAGVRFRVFRKGRSPNRYLVIHGNERTAWTLLAEHMRTHPGIAHLVTGTERAVRLGGALLDPNRIFSREGAEASLRNLNPGFPADRARTLLARLDRERPKLVRALLPPPGGRLVALHNNSDSYSVLDEVQLSEETSLKAPDAPHEFMLCTDPADFRILSASPYNVILQRAAPPPDDGSLSRLAARLAARYVNIEAGHGRAREQAAMLDWLERHLP